MLENFIEYMWYLLTTPFKKIKKTLNKWYVFCRVFGRRFDDAKESLLRARDEGMVATCSELMLPVHAADRKLTRYAGEEAENFRKRIALHEEVCRLGGLNEGVLLAVSTLGYDNVEIVRYRDYRGDGTRWAEFIVIIRMDIGDSHPISFDILRKTVRKWKEVGARDNYSMAYTTSVKTSERNAYQVTYRKFLYFFNYRKLDGRWQLDGTYLLDAVIHEYPTRIGFRYRGVDYSTGHKAGLSDAWYHCRNNHTERNAYRVAYIEKFIYYDYLRLDGRWQLDGSELLNGQIAPEKIRWAAWYRAEHQETVRQSISYRMAGSREPKEDISFSGKYRLTLDYFDYLKLNGLWYLTGSRMLNAQRAPRNIRMSVMTGVLHEHRTDSRTEYRTVIKEHMEAEATGNRYRLTLDYFDYLKLNGLWYLTGSRALDAQRSGYPVRIE